jgi:predicted transcriptional regulator YdeE
VDNAIYSIYTEYESDHTKPYTTVLGCKVKNLDQIPDGMVGKQFEGGSYLQIIANGDLTTGLVAGEWMKIWESDMNRIFTADYEVYGEKAQDPTNAEVDFLIAVES